MKLRKRLYSLYRHFMLDHFPAVLLGEEWKKWTGKPLDWKHPKNLNEKIQWLIRYSDTTEWTRLSDKVQVRDYVSQKGLAHILIPLLGTWKKSADIPFDSLPEKFVLKCNHDSGSTHIVDSLTNRAQVCQELDKALSQPYGYRHGEIHYNGIKPCILAESYLDSGETAPIDYKVWCFDGKPYCIWTCYGRTQDYTYVNVYSLDWEPRPEASVFTDHYRDGGGKLPRPQTLTQMLEAAATLSQGFPEVRVDFYEVGGKLYFGEMTFASLMGRMDYFTEDFLLEMGSHVTLPAKNQKGKK